MYIKKYFTAFVLILFSIIGSSYKTADAQIQKSRLRRIVVDPGHGGHDSGALGKYSTEKAVSLAISLKIDELLREQLPDVEVILTRKTDVFHSPVVKANIANQAKGDLFVCIHCNSADPIRRTEVVGYKTVTKGKGKKKRSVQVKEYAHHSSPNPAKGTETYIWGVSKNDDKERALRENESLFLDSSLSDKNWNSLEKLQLISLKTRNYFERSANLALTIEEEFKKVGRVSREAQQRQVGIWVLQAVAMPSVLIETGFISNPEEEDYLNSVSGQTEIAQAVVNAIIKYKKSLDSKMVH